MMGFVTFFLLLWDLSLGWDLSHMCGLCHGVCQFFEIFTGVGISHIWVEFVVGFFMNLGARKILFLP